MHMTLVDCLGDIVRWLRCQECSQICLLKEGSEEAEVSIFCLNVLGLLIMRCPVKTCSQTVQVMSALQRMFPLSYIDIHSINVSV